MGARRRTSEVLPADRSVGVPCGSSAEARFPPGTLHPLLVGMRDAFGASAPNDTGHLRPSKRKLVDVFVGKDQHERALDFLNTLFKTLESHGHRVDLASARGHVRRLALDIREASKREYHWSRD